MRKEFIRLKIDEKKKATTNQAYAGIHWGKRQTLAKYFHDLIQDEAEKLYPFTKKVNLRFDFFFEKNALDSSNCSFMGKMLEDGMTSKKDKNGKEKEPLLQGDSNKFVGEVTYKSHKGSKGDGIYVEIIISTE